MTDNQQCGHQGRSPLSRDLNDLQESAAWRVYEGGALQAQETRTNSAEEEHA